MPDLRAALRCEGRAVLQAPPGAGKTTRVPLALLPDVAGRIVMLEPRRLAARAAAERMAATLGEAPGGTVGYRIRGEARVSRATRIEVVTEGILTRMIQSDPALDGISAVIFDEFHERSIHADLGLALAWEVREALRPDLRLLVMSATLDAAPVATLMDSAPVVTAEGRAFPVETRWLPAPLPRTARLEAAMADLIATAAGATEGGILAFLPGEAEIRRVAAALEGRLGQGVAIQPLFGAMPFARQQAALAPVSGVRKLVLATSAETSLTIPDIRVVVDSGRARRARHDPGSGLGRLVTERASRAEAEQRRGRAGRVAPGVCFRLWARTEEGAIPAHPPAEIETADLAGLALELAAWGGGDGLRFLTLPPAGPLAAARALLSDLGALDGAGRITGHGARMAALPLHPRLAHLLLTAGPQAAMLAALASDRDPLPGAAPDLGLRLDVLRGRRRAPVPVHDATLARIRDEARRLSRLAGPQRGDLSPGAMAALAWPDRVGLRRPGGAPRWLLSGGRGAAMEPGLPLSQAPLIVATDLDGAGREARIRQAAELTLDELRALFPDRLCWQDRCFWSARDGRVMARRQLGFGALVLEDRPWPDPPPEALARAALDGLRDEIRQGNGLPMT
ncbi:MAG: ATP-dependent helicase HrpB, partial [Gemmobacter sp.]